MSAEFRWPQRVNCSTVHVPVTVLRSESFPHRLQHLIRIVRGIRWPNETSMCGTVPMSRQ